MSSLGQLVAGIAHEINNPVSFIYGNAHHAAGYVKDLIDLMHLYQEQYPEPPQVISERLEEIDLEYLVRDFSSLLASIENGATRIRDIIKSLRIFSRLDESGCKAIDLHENIDSTLMILQSRFNGRDGKPEIQLIKNYGDLPRIQCYVGLLNQVFVNLLMNAIEAIDSVRSRAAIEQQRNSLEPALYSEYSGVISITTSLTTTNQTIISIQDNGCGMDAQVQEKIFNPFFTTKSIGQGTGMGLAISYQIVTENHHGEISVSSELDKGTNMTLTLPRLSLDCSMPLG
jgi:signal transduction histidine kinase